MAYEAKNFKVYATHSPIGESGSPELGFGSEIPGTSAGVCWRAVLSLRLLASTWASAQSMLFVKADIAAFLLHIAFENLTSSPVTLGDENVEERIVCSMRSFEAG